MAQIWQKVALFLVIVMPVLAQWEYRLMGGPNRKEGRLEIKLTPSGRWGTVCKDGFNGNDAVVACRSLGIIGGANFITNAETKYGSANNLPIWLRAFQCMGNELNLQRCIWSDQTNACSHQEDIGLECLGHVNEPATTVAPDFSTLPPITCSNNDERVRLVGGDATSGRVEVKYNGVWGTICDNDWDKIDAKIICDMLCSDSSNAHAVLNSQFPSASAGTKIWMDGVKCVGDERQIDRCPHLGWGNTTRCTHNKDAGVVCSPPDAPVIKLLQPVIECNETHIVAKLKKSDYPDLTLPYIGLQNPGSNCDLKKEETTTEIILSVPVVGCNTKKSFNSTHIIYKNTLLRKVKSDGEITRQPQYTVEVACEVLRRREDTSEVIESINIHAPPVAGSTVFKVQMALVDPATNQIKQAPVQLQLGDVAGAMMVLTNQDPELKLIVPDCFAAPTPTVTATTKTYPLITDKCRTDTSVTIRRNDQKSMGFTFTTFMFMDGQAIDPNLYLHCTGVVCGTQETSAFCDQTCAQAATGRRKRDLSRYTRDLERFKREATSMGLTVVQEVEGPFIMDYNKTQEAFEHNGIVWIEDMHDPTPKKQQPEAQIPKSDNISSASYRNHVLWSSLVMVVMAIALL